MRAIRGLHTPQAITTYSASITALVGDDRLDPSSIGLDAEDLGVGQGLQRSQTLVAFSRKIVPARSESTADTVGK